MELKDRLYKAIIDNPMSIAELSKCIGVSHHMLCKFLKGNHELSFKNRMMIEKWLRDKELE